MRAGRKIIEQRLGRPIANVTFAMMHGYIRSLQRRGVAIMHTARPFAHYRKVFYGGKSRAKVITGLRGKRVVDVGCGYTPFAEDSMFQACHRAGIEFYGVDPLIDTNIRFGFRERALARATGSSGRFNTHPPGLDKALPATGQQLPFDDDSVDEILCSYLLFVWIEDEDLLADILTEFHRVLKPGGIAKIYPLYEWRFVAIKNTRLQHILTQFTIEQRFVHGHGDMRIMPCMLTRMTKFQAQDSPD